MPQKAIIAGLAVAAFALGPLPAQGAGPDAEAGAPHGRLLRVIEDPWAGARWLVYEDSEHPGRPARLVEAPLEATDANLRNSRPRILHSGDRLIVEEHTAVADASLAAVALGEAAEGEVVAVRLAIGGRVVKAVAEGRGRARLASGPDGQP